MIAGARMRRGAFAAAGLALLVTVGGCTPSRVGGVRGATAFAATARLETHLSPEPPARIAACFRRSARFLPGSRFTTKPDGSFGYTLAGHGLWFETLTIAPAPEGSRIALRSAANYDAGWVAMLVRDRLEPLGACLRPLTATIGDRP